MTLSTALILRIAPVSGKTAVRHVVALVAAASAGVHAGLVPEHIREGGARLGGAFALSAALLALVAVLVGARGASPRIWALAVTVLSGVAVAYLLSRTSGIPLLLAEPEQPDRLGVITTGAEVVAALAAAPLAVYRKEGP